YVGEMLNDFGHVLMTGPSERERKQEVSCHINSHCMLLQQSSSVWRIPSGMYRGDIQPNKVSRRHWTYIQL
ncbi:hypothetical protein BYT27DRAFT_7199781, partial [Phlegmacium glaucopus]